MDDMPMGTQTYPKQLPGSGTPAAPPRFRAYERMDNAQIVAWCQAGDRKAMDVLMARFQRAIYSRAHRLAGNPEDANDVAAAAMLQICQNIDKCRSAVTLAAWVNRIVFNIYCDMCRTARRHKTVSLEALTKDRGGAAAEFLDSQEKGPLILASESEKRDLLHRALARMSEFQASILTEFYFEDRSYEEIAEISHVPVGTVKSRLNRARRALLRKLELYRTAFVS